jgi:signal transduction histidine kinase
VKYGDDGRTVLPESEEMLALAQEVGRFGFFEWWVQKKEIRFSSALLSYYGLKNFTGSYESWRKHIFREDQPRIADLLEKTFAAQQRELQFQFRIAGPDGLLKWMEARDIIEYDAEGRPERITGVHVDVTEQKQALVQLRNFTETLEAAVKERTRELEAQNEARLKAEESLRQVQKMEVVGQLTGGIAHDFNNLLTIILGGISASERQVQNMEPSAAVARIRRANDMATQGARRAVTLVQRLLAFSRQQPLEPKPIDANKLVLSVSELLRRTLGATISLETVLAGGLWSAHADGNQLENALLNLAVNARDAMPDGGKVTIETANCFLDEAYVARLPEPVKPGQYLMIAVADTGAGMDPITLERAFEPFFTTKDVGKGTGLGLSQVYGFVRQSGGHVKIYSEVGHGTTVKIYLPRYVGTDMDVEDNLSTSVAHNLGSETILVVEDDEMVRSYAVEILSELGYRVLEARAAEDALDILDSESGIDLLFTDIVMPGGINGRQLADEALLRRPALKVLYTTGYTRNAIVHHGRLDAGVNLITKPFTFDALGTKVRTLLDER